MLINVDLNGIAVMPRPCCMRHVATLPPADFFKPAGVPCRDLEIVTLALDELEALRLADLEGLYQEDASARMNVSRQTFARIIEAARRKAADALIHGKALRLEGGAVTLKGAAAKPCGCGARRARPEKSGKGNRRA